MVPGISTKIIAANEHLMFTDGKVKNVDIDHNTLSVSSVEGSDTEIFPIKHGTACLYLRRLQEKTGYSCAGHPGDRLLRPTL